MKRLVLFAFTVFCVSASLCVCASSVNADEYLLRIDTVGFVDIPASEQDPQEAILRSVEVVARPDATFHSKVTTKVVTGSERLLVKGKLRPADDGGFELQIDYQYSIDLEQGVTAENGERIPARHTTRISTRVTFADGADTVSLSALESIKTEEGKPDRRSKIHFVLHLSKYTPTDY